MKEMENMNQYEHSPKLVDNFHSVKDNNLNFPVWKLISFFNDYFYKQISFNVFMYRLNYIFLELYIESFFIEIWNANVICLHLLQ